MGTDAKVTLGIIALLLLYGLVGRMDYVDALEQENQSLKHKAAMCGHAMKFTSANTAMRGES